jgi:hypothetical protein
LVTTSSTSYSQISSEELTMAVEVDIDVALLKSEIKRTYAPVSQEPENDFIFPTGRAWAEDLDYPEELRRVPDFVVESFAGVANPFSLGHLRSKFEDTRRKALKDGVQGRR